PRRMAETRPRRDPATGNRFRAPWWPGTPYVAASARGLLSGGGNGSERRRPGGLAPGHHRHRAGPGAGRAGGGGSARPRGPPRRLAGPFPLGTRGLDRIEAFGLRGVHRFEALGWRPAVLADPDVQSSLRHRYLDRLGGHDAVPELLSTLRLYFACGMRVDRTAERMSLHRNTLRHRIARFEKLT